MMEKNPKDSCANIGAKNSPNLVATSFNNVSITSVQNLRIAPITSATNLSDVPIQSGKRFCSTPISIDNEKSILSRLSASHSGHQSERSGESTILNGKENSSQAGNN